MTRRESPSQEPNLFPDSWIVGSAAAALARNDPGVLLHQAPVASEEVEKGAQPVGPRLPSAAELAELHQAMTRLEQRFALARTRPGRLDRLSTDIGVQLTALRDGQTRSESRLRSDIDRIETDAFSRSPAQRRFSLGFAFLLVLSIAATAVGYWLVKAESVRQGAEFGERLARASSGFQAGFTELVRSLDAQFGAVRDDVGQLGDRLDETWRRPRAQDDQGRHLAQRVDRQHATLGGLEDRAAAGARRPDRAPPAATIEALRARVQGPDWWQRQDPGRYTVQLVSVSRETDLYRFLQEHREIPFDALGVIRIPHSGGNSYSLVQGSYASLTQARAALGALSPDLMHNRPWIRRLGEIRDAFI